MGPDERESKILKYNKRIKGKSQKKKKKKKKRKYLREQP